MIGNPLQVTDPATEKARRARLQQSASRGQLVHLAQLSGNSVVEQLSGNSVVEQQSSLSYGG